MRRVSVSYRRLLFDVGEGSKVTEHRTCGVRLIIGGIMGFEQGNSKDGKHYWLTPPDLMAKLDAEHKFTFDPCPYPKPEDFDGLDAEWGDSNYVNPPFGVVMHKGKKKGATAWARKCIDEYKKGKKVVMVYPIDKWVLMLLDAGAEVRNLKDVKWCATEDGSAGPGTGRHIACFILDPSENDDTERAHDARVSDGSTTVI